jgi:excisionase family DNA binding protein
MEITVPEAAARARRTQETIRRWIWSGRLPARKIGNQHVIEEQELERLIGASEADRWRRYLERRDALLTGISEESRARLAKIEIAAWVDEDRDSH